MFSAQEKVGEGAEAGRPEACAQLGDDSCTAMSQLGWRRKDWGQGNSRGDPWDTGGGGEGWCEPGSWHWRGRQGQKDAPRLGQRAGLKRGLQFPRRPRLPAEGPRPVGPLPHTTSRKMKTLCHPQVVPPRLTLAQEAGVGRARHWGRCPQLDTQSSV